MFLIAERQFLLASTWISGTIPVCSQWHYTSKWKLYVNHRSINCKIVINSEIWSFVCRAGFSLDRIFMSKNTTHLAHRVVVCCCGAGESPLCHNGTAMELLIFRSILGINEPVAKMVQRIFRIPRLLFWALFSRLLSPILFVELSSSYGG